MKCLPMGLCNEDNDKKFEELGITQITTAVRGRESKIEKKIKQTEQSPETYTVECPHQKIISVPKKNVTRPITISTFVKTAR